MMSKERVAAAVAHREPDRVPLMYRDVAEVRSRLKRDLKLHSDEELFQAFGIDFRWAEPEWVGPELRISDGLRRDHWGIEWKYTRFSETAGYWNEKKPPLADEENPEIARALPLPNLDWWDFTGLKDRSEQCSNYAVMTAPGVSSPGILQSPIQSLVGAQRSLVDLYINPEFMRALIDRVMEFILPFVKSMLSAGKFDFFRMGDDFGTQQGPLIGKELWDSFFREPMHKLALAAKETGARFYLHSCGSLRSLIPGLIEIGVDVLDPFQITAAGMDPLELKREFGKRICFSGGVDEQFLLRQGSPEEIRDGVWRLLDVMMPGGGFILGPTHNFQDDIPTANIVAMYEAARSWPG